ncbi:MAG: hypothetical protein MI747_13905, partial [Desulfobacterales bacterium]|nr:hypothetical protein [Desulfobacterales bacterium]
MKENEIRPQALLDEYLRLSREDAATCFPDTDRNDVPCVACQGTEAVFQFSKHGFGFVQCEGCGSMFQSPRPSMVAFERFYRGSKSSDFWANQFFPTVAEARRDKIFKPRVEKIRTYFTGKNFEIRRLVEVGAGYGIFLEEWRKQNEKSELIAIEP